MTDFKIGDKVKVVRDTGFYGPSIGNTGYVVSVINGYPKIKFDNPEIYIEDIGGYCTVEPDLLVII
jgi:hypothetical protein